MNDAFLHIESHARAMLVEQVMAIHGRGSSDPKTYRRILEGMSMAALQRAIDESDFPAQPSLTETAGVIASTDTGHAPGSARETLTTEAAQL